MNENCTDGYILGEDLKVDIMNNIQVYFTKESALHDINVNSEWVDEISIEDGFLKIHDKYEKCWHNYNLKHVIHFHIPG